MTHCVSCLADSSKNDDVFLSLYKTYICDGDEEIYADMFKFCFNIIFKLDDEDDNDDKVICSNCLLKLKSANDFKLQTINIQDILQKGIPIESVDSGQDMKAEYLDMSLWDAEVKVETEVKMEDDDYDHESAISIEELDQDFFEDYEDKIAKLLPNNNEIVVRKVKMEMEPKYLSDTYRKKLTKKGRVKKNSFIAKPYTLKAGQTSCDYCDSTFVYQKLLVEHMNVHFPNCVCATCGKKYVNKESLKRHEKSHWVGPFTCNVCDKVFNTYNTFTAHKYYKHSEDPYRCRHCTLRFSTFMKRLKHMIQEHNIECKYSCDFCNKKFYHSGQRTAHIRKVHMGINAVVACSSCPKTFPTRDLMKEHKAKEHNANAVHKYVCGVCNRNFKSMTALKHHMRSHGSGPRYMCHVCNTSFIYKCSLTNHVINHQKNGINAVVIGDSAIVEDDNYSENI